ncbi:MAG: hypothetical protein J6C82_08560 [Clostridia bacterium]|nr:hypothetical protein [Clostridia bacterium]
MSNEQSKEQEMQIMALETEIEQILCKVFNCSTRACWCIHMRNYPYFSMTQALSFLCAKYPREGVLYMQPFIEKYSFIARFSLDDLLSCDSDTIVLDGIRYHLDKENGLEFVKYLISEFKKVVTKVIDLEE